MVEQQALKVIIIFISGVIPMTEHAFTKNIVCMYYHVLVLWSGTSTGSSFSN